jgi:hypothetical protein
MVPAPNPARQTAFYHHSCTKLTKVLMAGRVSGSHQTGQANLGITLVQNCSMDRISFACGIKLL